MTNTEFRTLFEALRFAAARHATQKRKGTSAVPYINHPIEVATLLATVGGVTDVETLAAAILHDTVEDTGVKIEEIRERFGDDVAGLVAELTDDKSLPKARRKELQVENASHKSVRAKCIKLADKISNIRDITNDPPEDWSIDRRMAYFDWAAAVIAGVRGANPALEQAFDEALAAGRVRYAHEAIAAGA